MNNKGFTLVELLAMLAVLAILMGVAIPNITGILKNQKKNTLKNDAVTLVETAKTKVAREELIKKPNTNECVVFSLTYLNDNDNVEVGPNGGKYEEYGSFVVMKKECNNQGCEYKYYIRLVEDNGSYFYGVSNPTEINTLNNNDSTAITKIKKSEYGEGYGINQDSTSSSFTGKLSGICGRVVNYYQKTKKTCTHDHNPVDPDNPNIYYDKDGNVVSNQSDCIKSGCSSC